MSFGFYFFQISDWDRYAAVEYELLVAEEGGGDSQDDMYVEFCFWGGVVKGREALIKKKFLSRGGSEKVDKYIYIFFLLF